MDSSSSETYKLRELREVFNIFDLDKSGSISVNEMEQFFKSLGIDASRDEIKLVVNEMDIDGDGEISFKEFAKVMGVKLYQNYTESEIKVAFSHFDKNGDGSITCEELMECMAKMGKNYTKREIKRMIDTDDTIDTDGNGMVTIDEFAKLLE